MPPRLRWSRRRAVSGSFGATLLLLILASAACSGSGANQVIGSPTRAQVAGTWVGDGGLTLVLRPDGTFTSPGLPRHVGAAAPVISAGGSVPGAWSGHGTWAIGHADFDGSPESVIFTVDCGAASTGCAGHPGTFGLQAETNAPAGGGGPALFYYLGSNRNLSSQYPFVRGH